MVGRSQYGVSFNVLHMELPFICAYLRDVRTLTIVDYNTTLNRLDQPYLVRALSDMRIESEQLPAELQLPITFHYKSFEELESEFGVSKQK